jgi:hypothetical protein
MASALTGAGVRETFVKLLEVAYPILDKNFSLGEAHATDMQSFINAATGASLGKAD